MSMARRISTARTETRAETKAESTSRLEAIARWPRHLLAHLRIDGVAVAIAFALRGVRAWLQRAPRDPGERAAERFLRTLGYRVIARNWRSPRDRRDEADLIVLSPDARELVIVEVKRAAGPWDALERVDSRKKEVLWRLLVDLEEMPRRPVVPEDAALRRLASRVDAIRVDLVGVRGEGRSAVAIEQACGVFSRARRPPPR